MEYGIREHALCYALLAKAVLETEGLKNAEALLETITREYGNRRGRRMRANAAAAGLGDDLAAFFSVGEWTGKPGENRSELAVSGDSTESRVRVCAWYDTWKQYGLLPWGTYYCRWIDPAIAEGFQGSFTLSVPMTMGNGDGSCRFVWNQTVPEQTGGRPYLRPFSFHTEELMTAAEDILRTHVPEEADAILKRTEDAFRQFLTE